MYVYVGQTSSAAASSGRFYIASEVKLWMIYEVIVTNIEDSICKFSVQLKELIFRRKLDCVRLIGIGRNRAQAVKCTLYGTCGRECWSVCDQARNTSRHYFTPVPLSTASQYGFNSTYVLFQESRICLTGWRHSSTKDVWTLWSKDWSESSLYRSCNTWTKINICIHCYFKLFPLYQDGCPTWCPVYRYIRAGNRLVMGKYCVTSQCEESLHKYSVKGKPIWQMDSNEIFSMCQTMIVDTGSGRVQWPIEHHVTLP